MKENNNLYLIERQNKILDLLREKKKATVNDLSKFFKISGVTARNELKELAKSGKIIRTHGGAIYIDNSEAEGIYNYRKNQNITQKKRIVKVASTLINDGEVIFIDASTTASHIIPFLNEKMELTVVTNSVEVAHILATSSLINILLIGGKIRREALSTTGYPVDYILKDINLSKAFMGASGFTIEEGLTDVNQEEINIKKYIVEKSKSTIALIDSSKCGKVSFGTFAETKRISIFITDKKTPKGMIDKLKSIGVKVLIAE